MHREINWHSDMRKYWDEKIWDRGRYYTRKCWPQRNGKLIPLEHGNKKIMLKIWEHTKNMGTC